MKKLSIIIVSWNTGDLTEQTLASVYREYTPETVEVIVVDNHSSDETVTMIQREFSTAWLIVNANNRGFGKANNQGMAIATGQYIMLLNSDTIVQPGGIQNLVAYLDTHNDVMMVGPKLLNADGTFQHACRRRLPQPVNAFFHLFGLSRLFPESQKFTEYKRYADDPEKTEPVEALSGAAMMFRREVYETVGGLDERFFMYGEDLDFCKRVSDHGWEIAYVSEAKIIHLGGQSSRKRRSRSLVDFYQSMWLYYRKHFVGKKLRIRDTVVWIGIWLRCGMALLMNVMKT